MARCILTLSYAIFFSWTALAETVEFRIAPGTGEKAWNTQLNPIEARVGDVIRFYNEDNVNHQLHTFGSPCPHGSNMAPGQQWDCHVTSTLSSSVEGPLYDHHYGDAAEVWFEVTESAF